MADEREYAQVLAHTFELGLREGFRRDPSSIPFLSLRIPGHAEKSLGWDSATEDEGNGDRGASWIDLTGRMDGQWVSLVEGQVQEGRLEAR